VADVREKRKDIPLNLGLFDQSKGKHVKGDWEKHGITEGGGVTGGRELRILAWIDAKLSLPIKIGKMKEKNG